MEDAAQLFLGQRLGCAIGVGAAFEVAGEDGPGVEVACFEQVEESGCVHQLWD